MIPGLNPRDMAKAMKKLGMKQEELNVKKVVMFLEDKELVFENPQVLKVDMMGQESYQLTGEPVERALEVQINEEDIKTVMEQTNSDHDSALKAIKSNNGDLAAAILELQQK